MTCTIFAIARASSLEEKELLNGVLRKIFVEIIRGFIKITIQKDFEPLPKPWLDISESAIIPSCADYKVDIGHFITQLD